MGISTIVPNEEGSVRDLIEMADRALLAYKGKGHFVIIGWSKNAELAIQEILCSDPNMDIVLVDRAEKTPLSHEMPGCL